MKKKKLLSGSAIFGALLALFLFSGLQKGFCQFDLTGKAGSLTAAEQSVERASSAESQGGEGEVNEELQDYVIHPGDILSVLVWDNPNLSLTVSVRDDGNISYPLIGNIKAGGLTVSDFQKNLTDALANDYVVNPRVVVDVKTRLVKDRFFVYGEVQRPGSFPLEGDIDILKAISMAGGLTDFGSQKVKIVREEDGKRKVIKVNLKALTRAGKVDKRLFIEKNDTVIVERSLFW
ncbi:MAG: polysaccharide biosynthesis/export family protein [Candidatus Omnitrophica bacterium]|nr:polysaccharide biosynthesis/export family protein [Candidatus Omnitrophota bacterium]